MTRAEVRAFIKTGAESIDPPSNFYEGLISDFAHVRTNEYPAILFVFESVDSDIPKSAPLDDWDIKLYVVKQDRLDSISSVYEALVDECDLMAQKLVYKYRNIVSGYKLVSMSSTTRNRLIKTPRLGADCLTGVELLFKLTAPDQTDVC